MSKGLSYSYSGTKGHIVAVADSLPKTGAGLLKRGWEEISYPEQARHGHYTYREPHTGLRVRYDRETVGSSGYAGKSHYHILNPNATGNHNLYLDRNGNPVRKNSKASHILPNTEEDK